MPDLTSRPGMRARWVWQAEYWDPAVIAIAWLLIGMVAFLVGALAHSHKGTARWWWLDTLLISVWLGPLGSASRASIITSSTATNATRTEGASSDAPPLGLRWRTS